MKILFITKADGPDYMSDMIFHGGKSIFGVNFYETNKLSYMYDDFENKINLYGRGFTMYGKIKNNLYSTLPGKITELISDKFFDKIIYGSIWRCDDYLDLVTKTYSNNDILIIDGEDTPNIKENVKKMGKYFKRELYDDYEDTYPINFCIPEELIIDEVKEKSKDISDIMPANPSNRNYTYTNEKDYYKEYLESWFAHTRKKGGWDSLRHYEIMMNGCVPLFENLEGCPKNTMVDFPKKEVLKFMKEGKNIENNQYILDYTKNKLTTKKIIEKIL